MVGLAAIIAGGCAAGVSPMEPTPATALKETVAPPVSVAPTITPTPAEPAIAQYRVTFTSTWTSSTHPADFPDDVAHFSGLIGGTHKSTVAFWTEGQFATTGIKDMAERGSKSPLDREIQTAIAAGTAEFVLSGGTIALSPGSVGMDFTISRDFPSVTLVTMIAPSPDWFVGVAGLPLIVDNAWRNDVTVALYPFDAGTDSGSSFRSPDLVSQPFELIHRLTGNPFLWNGVVSPLGTFRFVRR